MNGRRGLPVRIHGQGFRFRFHELEAALEDLLRTPKPETTRETVPDAGWAGTFAR
ncbi:MAG: DUF1731 domain-containing protein [Verrucomicrobiota bacterium]